MHGNAARVLLLAGTLSGRATGAAVDCRSGIPPVWPHRFTLVQRKIPDNASLGLSTTVTYYDWARGANLIVITPDADPSAVLFDLELNSRHSYYFTPSAVWKAAAQRLRPIRQLQHATPAPDQAQGGLQPRPRPASVSLGQLAGMFWLAGHTPVLFSTQAQHELLHAHELSGGHPPPRLAVQRHLSGPLHSQRPPRTGMDQGRLYRLLRRPVDLRARLMHVENKLARPLASWRSGGVFQRQSSPGLSQAQANQPLGWLWPDRDRETDRSKQKPTPGRQTVPYRACFSTQVSWYFHAMKARFDTVYYANNASVADPAMLLPPAYCNATMGGVSGRQ